MITPELLLTLLIVVAVLALAGIGAAWRALRRVQVLERRLRAVDALASQTHEHFEGLSAGSLGQGQQLGRLEQELGRLRTRLDQLAANADGTGNGAAFSQAIRMARKGCGAREIMETCGLSQVEADLVVLLHKEQP